MKSINNFLKFGGLSGFSFIVNIGVTFFCHEYIGLHEELSYAIALVTVLVTNFLGLRYAVFKAQKSKPGRQFLYFVLSSIGFRVVEYIIFIIIHSWLGLYYLLAIVLISIVFTVLKFFFYGSTLFKTPQWV